MKYSIMRKMVILLSIDRNLSNLMIGVVYYSNEKKERIVKQRKREKFHRKNQTNFNHIKYNRYLQVKLSEL